VSINLRVTHAKWHILDKQAAASDRDIRNIQDIKDTTIPNQRMHSTS